MCRKKNKGNHQKGNHQPINKSIASFPLPTGAPCQPAPGRPDSSRHVCLRLLGERGSTICRGKALGFCTLIFRVFQNFWGKRFFQPFPLFLALILHFCRFFLQKISGICVFFPIFYKKIPTGKNLCFLGLHFSPTQMEKNLKILNLLTFFTKPISILRRKKNLPGLVHFSSKNKIIFFLTRTHIDTFFEVFSKYCQVV